MYIYYAGLLHVSTVAQWVKILIRPVYSVLCLAFLYYEKYTFGFIYVPQEYMLQISKSKFLAKIWHSCGSFKAFMGRYKFSYMSGMQDENSL